MHLEKLNTKNFCEFKDFFLKEKVSELDFEILKNKNCFIIKDNRKKIFGFSSTLANFIDFFYLKEGYRHKTYGSKLLLFTEEFLFRYFIVIKVNNSIINDFFKKNVWKINDIYLFKEKKYLE